MTMTRRGDNDDDGAVTLTDDMLTRQCLRHGGFRTAELNTTLYLGHCRLARLDAALGAYAACVVVYVDHNALDSLAAFAALPQLSQLYASHNALSGSLRAVLPHALPALRTLDVSHNALCDLRGLAAAAPQLTTLLAANNAITTLPGGDGEHAAAPRSCLTTLDVSHNALADEAAVMRALAAHAATLRTCAVDGNAFLRGARAWRRRCVAALPQLRCLDNRPVDDDERACAAAFVAGGAAAEATTRAALATAAAQRRDEQRRYCDAVLAAARRRGQQQQQQQQCNDDDAPLYIGGGGAATAANVH